MWKCSHHCLYLFLNDCPVSFCNKYANLLTIFKYTSWKVPQNGDIFHDVLRVTTAFSWHSSTWNSCMISEKFSVSQILIISNSSWDSWENLISAIVVSNVPHHNKYISITHLHCRANRVRWNITTWLFGLLTLYWWVIVTILWNFQNFCLKIVGLRGLTCLMQKLMEISFRSK